VDDVNYKYDKHRGDALQRWLPHAVTSSNHLMHYGQSLGRLFVDQCNNRQYVLQRRVLSIEILPEVVLQIAREFQ
jgi:hypothetical protein